MNQSFTSKNTCYTLLLTILGLQNSTRFKENIAQLTYERAGS